MQVKPGASTSIPHTLFFLPNSIVLVFSDHLSAVSYSIAEAVICLSFFTKQATVFTVIRPQNVSFSRIFWELASSLEGDQYALALPVVNKTANTGKRGC